MNQAQYEAIVTRVGEVAERESVLPERARLHATALRILTEPLPESDDARRERLVRLYQECDATGQLLAEASVIGVTDALGEMVGHNAVTLAFGISMALRVADATSLLDVSVVEDV